jgi:glycosyltransferase 2 family protein
LIRTLLKLLVVVVVVYIAVRSGFFVKVVESSDSNWLLSILAVQPIIGFSFLAQSIRYASLVGKPTVPVRYTFCAIVLSLGLNLVIPARMSELLKATYIRDHAGVSLSKGLAGLVLERAADMVIVATLALFALVNYYNWQGLLSILIVTAALTMVILALVRWPELVLRLIRILPYSRFVDFLEQVYLHFVETAKARAFGQALLLGVVAWSLSYLSIFVFLELAGSIAVGYSGALLVFVMTTLGGAIPALPGGLGTYEAAAVLALRSLGYGFDEALILAVMMHVSQVILPFVLAMLFMMTERIGVSSLVAELRQSKIKLEQRKYKND